MSTAQPSKIALISESDLRISNFYRARYVTDDKAVCPLFDNDLKVLEALGYPLEEAADFDARFDTFCVGVTLYQMATGQLPDLSLERDALLATIDDPLKRELVAFALRVKPLDRPMADDVVEKITILAPLCVMVGQFRAQVFASVRPNDEGPMAEAKLLRTDLASQGVHLHIIPPNTGVNADRTASKTMARCDGFIAMATETVRVQYCDYHLRLCFDMARTQYCADTCNTRHEVLTWQEQYQPDGKPLIPLRMVSVSKSALRECLAE